MTRIEYINQVYGLAADARSRVVEFVSAEIGSPSRYLALQGIFNTIDALADAAVAYTDQEGEHEQD